MRRFAFAFMALMLAAMAGLPAGAATSDWASVELAPEQTVEMRLIAAVDGTGTLAEIPAGLQVRLPEGWKTYWRSPGDAGLPPELDFAGSFNLIGHDLHYPVPHRFTLFGLDTFGYAGEVVFPITLRPGIPGGPLETQVHANLLICSDVCVPAAVDLALNIDPGPATPDAQAANLINRFASQVPEGPGVSGLEITALAPIDGAEPALLVRAEAREPFAEPDIFVEHGEFWSFGAPQISLDQQGRALTARLPILQQPTDAGPLAGADMRLTLVDGARAVEQSLTAGAPVPAGDLPAFSPAGASGSGAQAGQGTGLLAFVSMLGIAVLGGLILNLMPCVLPVLSIKLLHVVRAGGQAPSEVRAGFLATAAGIVASFLVLAGGLIAVKQAGGLVGWGMQFQQPIFIVFMVLLLTLFACNLLGLFEITLPGTVSDAAARAGEGESLWGHFGTGAFATLLATPCSAPFLGTAIGFALARGAGEILAIFAALGVGLALPYLAVAAFPRVARVLPRPGAWMVWLKRVLSLALIGTAVWLLSVLAAQTTMQTAVLLGALMLVIGVLVWARRRGGRLRPAATGLAGIVAIASFIVPGQLPGRASVAQIDPDWTTFDEAAIGDMVADGRIVFVDVTADWCITCLANKNLVIERGAVAEALATDRVVAMQADWTLPDDTIAGYLADHQRYGIPFNIIYGPGAPEGIALPELLTEGAVMDALLRAGLDS